MALGFGYKLVGQREIVRMLTKVAPVAANRALRPALNKGGTVTLRKMRALAPVQRPTPNRFGVRGVALPKPEKETARGGNLKRSLTRKYLFFKGSGNHVLLLGPGVKGTRRGKHGHLVEAGTKMRAQKTTGRSTGRMPAIRFMERAMDATHHEAAGVVASVFGARLMAEIRRNRRR